LEVQSNSLEENQIGAIALSSMLRGPQAGATGLDVQLRDVEVSRRSSYLAVLLPGVIAMTLLIIGLSGFGSVLIEEESQGLYKNLKTIDVSPAPFFSGLFLSRMLVAYTVAIGMFVVSVFALGVPMDINYPLMMLVVTLGAATFLGIGMIVFLFSRTVMAFNGIVSVIQVPLILLGGVFFSIAMFPKWLQPIAQFSPLAPFTSALRDLMFGGVGFHDVAQIYPSLITLSAWMVVTLLVARWRFRW
jgi:ABC-type multidrug transport system permease subunit